MKNASISQELIIKSTEVFKKEAIEFASGLGEYPERAIYTGLKDDAVHFAKALINELITNKVELVGYDSDSLPIIQATLALLIEKGFDIQANFAPINTYCLNSFLFGTTELSIAKKEIGRIHSSLKTAGIQMEKYQLISTEGVFPDAEYPTQTFAGTPGKTIGNIHLRGLSVLSYAPQQHPDFISLAKHVLMNSDKTINSL